MTEIAAIVLAAGRGTRFGETPKLLADMHGEVLLRYAVRAALEAGCSPILVVLGHCEVEIRAATEDLPVTFVANPNFAAGLSTSLRAGFAALPSSSDGAVILLGDMPQITPSIILSLIDTWRRTGEPDAVVPTYEGGRGNPVLLSRRLAAEIRDVTGDQGAGPLLRGRDSVVELAIDSPAVMLDVDTPEALSRIATRQADASTTPSRIAE